MVDQPPDVKRFFDTLLPVPEQVIEVPKIVCPLRAARTVLRAPQLAEQLVEVPTIVSYSSFQRTKEQHVDIPVQGRGGRHVGLQGFRTGQSSSASSSSPAGVHGFADELGEGGFSHLSHPRKSAAVVHASVRSSTLAAQLKAAQ